MLQFEVCRKCKGSKKLMAGLKKELSRMDCEAEAKFVDCLDKCKKSPVMKVKNLKPNKDVFWKRLDEKRLRKKLLPLRK